MLTDKSLFYNTSLNSFLCYIVFNIECIFMQQFTVLKIMSIDFVHIELIINIS